MAFKISRLVLTNLSQSLHAFVTADSHDGVPREGRWIGRTWRAAGSVRVPGGAFLS